MSISARALVSGNEPASAHPIAVVTPPSAESPTHDRIVVTSRWPQVGSIGVVRALGARWSMQQVLHAAAVVACSSVCWRLEQWQNGDWSVPWDQWRAGSALG